MKRKTAKDYLSFWILKKSYHQGTKAPRNARKLLLIIFLICTNYLSAFQIDTTEVKPYDVNKVLNSAVVSKVGNIEITAEEFLNGYEFGPAFIKRQKDSRERFVEYMSYEKLLALDGYSKRLDTLPDVKLFLTDIKNDLATEQLYRERIWNKIKVDSLEIERAVEKEQIDLQLKWIFKSSFDEIKEQFSLIKNGIPFDSLFVKQFSDSISYGDRYLETTRYKLEKTNPALASVIDSIKLGVPSTPIKTNDGWYIVKIENLWRNVITTESQKNDLKYSIEKYLTKLKADSASDVMVKKLLIENNGIIVRNTFNILKAFLGKKLLAPKVYDEWNLTKNIKVQKQLELENISEYNDEVLVKTKSGNFTLKNFLDWYTNREPYIHFDLKSHKGLFASLQSVVWRMVRDNILAQLAIKGKYDKDPDVEVQLKWWKDKVVYSKMKLEIANSIKISDDRMKEYYKDNLKKYSDKDGSPKSFDEVKKDVWTDCYVYEYTKKIVNRVLVLKQKHKIKINEDVLKQINVSDEYNPKTIEIYSVKKGGTFVRPVYPTIDFEWQFWN
ncbi:MAG: hypothetical protein NTX22_12125 [Ignavibacteriales bacterium]|nr:hypothetical protein [Ignavibacteriales bacterium]